MKNLENDINFITDGYFDFNDGLWKSGGIVIRNVYIIYIQGAALDFLVNFSTQVNLAQLRVIYILTGRINGGKCYHIMCTFLS